jgi:hypothetical protein
MRRNNEKLREFETFLAGAIKRGAVSASDVLDDIRCHIHMNTLLRLYPDQDSEFITATTAALASLDKRLR